MYELFRGTILLNLNSKTCFRIFTHPISKFCGYFRCRAKSPIAGHKRSGLICDGASGLSDVDGGKTALLN
jgi:hypothetical protein